MPEGIHIRVATHHFSEKQALELSRANDVLIQVAGLVRQDIDSGAQLLPRALKFFRHSPQFGRIAGRDGKRQGYDSRTALLFQYPVLEVEYPTVFREHLAG